MNRANKYIESMREYLAEYAGAQTMFAWASAALEQGADADEIQYQVMKYNIKGLNHDK